jgi:hypothetical protein
MHFFKSLPLFIGLAAMAASAPAQAGAQNSYTVELNKTEIVRLPSAATSIIVGNPKIADVTVQSSDLIFVVGRGYGETNLIILDSQGNTMMNADLQVVNTLPHQGVRLYNGKNRETYSCIPFCGPSPVLGDDRGFISANTSSERNLTSFPAFNAASSAPDNTTAPAGGPLNASNALQPQQTIRQPN